MLQDYKDVLVFPLQLVKQETSITNMMFQRQFECLRWNRKKGSNGPHLPDVQATAWWQIIHREIKLMRFEYAIEVQSVGKELSTLQIVRVFVFIYFNFVSSFHSYIVNDIFFKQGYLLNTYKTFLTLRKFQLSAGSKAISKMAAACDVIYLTVVAMETN